MSLLNLDPWMRLFISSLFSICRNLVFGGISSALETDRKSLEKTNYCFIGMWGIAVGRLRRDSCIELVSNGTDRVNGQKSKDINKKGVSLIRGYMKTEREKEIALAFTLPAAQLELTNKQPCFHTYYHSNKRNRISQKAESEPLYQWYRCQQESNQCQQEEFKLATRLPDIRLKLTYQY